jgi:hypothetical protein
MGADLEIHHALTLNLHPPLGGIPAGDKHE